MEFDENGLAVFTDAERAEVAREHDTLTDRLEQEGNYDAAQDARDVALAARTSSAAPARAY